MIQEPGDRTGLFPDPSRIEKKQDTGPAVIAQTRENHLTSAESPYKNKIPNLGMIEKGKSQFFYMGKQNFI